MATTYTYRSTAVHPWETYLQPEAVQDPKYLHAVRRCYERDEDSAFGANVHFRCIFIFVNDLLCKNIGRACLGCKKRLWNQMSHTCPRNSHPLQLDFCRHALVKIFCCLHSSLF